MTRTEDELADRAAQLEAAYAAYSTGLDAIHAEHKRAVDAAAAAQTEGEARLFEAYSERVKRITGGPGPLAPPPAAEPPAAEPPSTIGADQEAADIEESGM